MGRKLKFSKRLRIPKQDQEIYLKKQGYQKVAGVDEVGRGSWAGPLVAAAVILPFKKLYKIRDSKLLTFKEREKLARKIKKAALGYGIAKVKHSEIDILGMTVAQSLAYERAVSKLKPKPDFLLVDGKFRIFTRISAKTIVWGDQTCISIASASILAKDYRDKLMIRLHKKYPNYRFDLHKGYGTKLHQQRLKKYGPCPVHRRLFTPINKMEK